MHVKLSILSICPFWSTFCMLRVSSLPLPLPLLPTSPRFVHLPGLPLAPNLFSHKAQLRETFRHSSPHIQPTFLFLNSYHAFGHLAHPALFSNFCCQMQQHWILCFAYLCLIQHHIPTAWTLKLRLNESKNEGFITYSLSLAEDKNWLTLPLTFLWKL